MLQPKNKKTHKQMHYCCDSSKHSKSALPSQWNKNKKTKNSSMNSKDKDVLK